MAYFYLLAAFVALTLEADAYTIGLCKSYTCSILRMLCTMIITCSPLHALFWQVNYLRRQALNVDFCLNMSFESTTVNLCIMDTQYLMQFVKKGKIIVNAMTLLAGVQSVMNQQKTEKHAEVLYNTIL